MMKICGVHNARIKNVLNKTSMEDAIATQTVLCFVNNSHCCTLYNMDNPTIWILEFTQISTARQDEYNAPGGDRLCEIRALV